MVSTLTLSRNKSYGNFSLVLLISLFLLITVKGETRIADDKLNFKASVSGSKVELQWSLVANQELSHFVVQRSTNGRDFSDAAMIMSDAGSPEHTYTYKELYGAQNGKVIYFRLKMVNADGLTTYSTVRAVRINTAVSPDTSIQPNPVTSELRINEPGTTEHWFRLKTATTRNEPYVKL